MGAGSHMTGFEHIERIPSGKVPLKFQRKSPPPTEQQCAVAGEDLTQTAADRLSCPSKQATPNRVNALSVDHIACR
jgi:ribosomal protein L34E